MPSSGELRSALRVFEVWLNELRSASEREVGHSFMPGVTLGEVAYGAGRAKGVDDALAYLKDRLHPQPDEPADELDE